MDASHSTDYDATHPTPLDFDEFLPWACQQLQIAITVLVSRTQQQDYANVSTSDRAKSKFKSKAKISSEATASSELDERQRESDTSGKKTIVINAVYDKDNNLVQINFKNNRTIPRLIMKIIGLIIKFHTHLTSIVINRGIDEYTIYEMCKFLPLSHITDVCLDGTYMKNANYQLLLEQNISIRYLSLARCGIDDVVVSTIADKLVHPFHASKSLSVLNLSSNRITDEGVISLANALRSNRRLNYLNVSNNMIKDEGAMYVLDVLMKFTISSAEVLATRLRYVTFLKDKNERIAELAKEMRFSDSDKRSAKQKSAKTTQKKGKNDENASQTKSATNLDTLLEKASAAVNETMGSFVDPYDNNNTYVKDGITYCFGNNSLCYLNLAYNNWSFLTLKKILSVLVYQRKISRKPMGLVNICIEGNYIPRCCRELQLIDSYIDDCLYYNSRETLTPKKKTNKIAK